MNGGRESSRFEEIYRSFSPSLQAYFSACFGPSLAEDLTQQLFLKLWSYLLGRPGFTPKDWKAWLFRSAVNLKNDYLRWAMLLPAPFALEEDEGGAAGPCAPDMESACLDRMAVRAALLSLRPKDRELLLLQYAGFSSGEIGSLLHLSASTVRSRLAAARERLQKLLPAPGNGGAAEPQADGKSKP